MEASGQYHKAILAHFRSLQLNPKYIFKYKYFLLLIFGWFVIIAYYSTHPLDFSWFWTFVYIGIQLSLSIIPLALKKLELEIHDFLQQRASILLFLQFNHPGYRFCFFIYRFCNIVYGIIQLLLSIISLELKNLELKLYGLFLQKILFNSSLDCRAKIKIRNDFVLNKDTAISQALVNKIDRHLISTLLLLPGEDGIFRVPILLLGTNWLNATIFGIIFGFYHIENQSALLCLEISIIMTISNLVVLPHSLLACIIGHLVSDLIIIKLNTYIYESRS